jgi:acetyl esterase/lipase
MQKKTSITFVFLFIAYLVGFGQERFLYKKVDTAQLYLEVYPSVINDPSKPAPAMVFFFGGGWNSGTVKQFEPHAKYFIQRGITCILVDYRVKEKHKSTPFESLKDAKSAIRYIRAHATDLHIDSSKIIASGG